MIDSHTLRSYIWWESLFIFKAVAVEQSGVKRKLAAIFSADVAGYSRLMGAEEEATLKTLTTYREAMDAFITRHGGRIVGTAGDSILAEFASAIEAVRCAIEIQQELKDRNTALSEDRRMEFRIGINLGDVMIEGDDIYGDGVNVAARIENLAEPGGLCISHTVFEQVRDRIPHDFEDLGEHSVKNITRPVRVYRVPPEPEATGGIIGRKAKDKRLLKPLRWRIPAAGVVVVIAVAAGVLLSLKPWVEKGELASVERMAYPLPDKPSIAVLPFNNLSDDPEQEYFADGMTEDLITDLSKLSGLFVISRSSTFTYKGRAIKVGQVAEELGVRYVLEGSVRRAGPEVRINAQLIDAMTGDHIWAERYDRDYTDIFRLQDEVIGEIVSALKVNLTESEKATLNQRPTDSLEAYEHYLRGLDASNGGTREGDIEARAWFRKAIALDASFAAAYELLGWTYYRAFAFQWEQGPDLLAQAFELAEKGSALEPNSVGAAMLRGHVYLWRRQFDLAITETEAALALNPNNADGYSDLGETLTWAGRPEEAVGWIRHAMRLNPEYPIFYSWNLGHAYWFTGRTEEAVSLMEEVVARSPDYLPAHGYLVVMYAELGQMEKARAEFAEMARLSPEVSLERTRQTLPYKNPAHLERFLDGLRKVAASVENNPAD